jgi:hypothetical protein
LEVGLVRPAARSARCLLSRPNKLRSVPVKGAMLDRIAPFTKALPN